MAIAGKLFEVGWGNLQGNGTLLAQIVAENEIALVIGEDEIGRLNILAYKIDGIGHVRPALVGALHPGLARFAEGDAGDDDEGCNCESAIPSAGRQTRYRQTDARNGGDN